ncbi:Succinate dehydrogenase cytochrome b560 subunit, mitochondrial [Harpegnathos saltator]|uniref:Succinate dehydrogenase cytochrome b560 subunit, mitochondrial n=2 Tax=Harpegnathos saltator TaxID=610380 RepID=E2BNN2_HARSA|nr:Succinate dehydrogenase cytochrome b560 subunit, mitochondrial [Harpegnathos saltator]
MTNLSRVVCETHDERNMRLKRPMSPHLTIYEFPLPAMLSITHRTTGIILSSYAMFLGLGTLCIPGGIPCAIEILNDLYIPSLILFVGKTLLALPITFHILNGIRHLAWDLGMFLKIKEVYSTGYVVSALAAISALVLAAM